MNNLSDFANFGELQIFLGSEGGAGGGAPNRSLRPGRQKPSLRLCPTPPHSSLLVVSQSLPNTLSLSHLSLTIHRNSDIFCGNSNKGS